MSWDFSTEPEFQRKLDWVDQFCREKVDPLEFVFPYAVRSPDPVVKAYVRELQQEVKDQGLWAIFLDREHGDARRLRHPGAEETVARATAQSGHLLRVLDDRTPGRQRPEPVQNPR